MCLEDFRCRNLGEVVVFVEVFFGKTLFGFTDKGQIDRAKVVQNSNSHEAVRCGLEFEDNNEEGWVAFEFDAVEHIVLTGNEAFVDILVRKDL